MAMMGVVWVIFFGTFIAISGLWNAIWLCGVLIGFLIILEYKNEKETKNSTGLTGLCLAFIAVLILCGIVVPVHAMSINDIQITPNGSVMVNQPISISLSIDPTPYNLYTENPDNSIVLSTALTSAQWTHSLELDEVNGQQVPATDTELYLPGWVLAYPLGTREHINVTLWGLAPNVSSSQNVILLRVSEYDKNNQVIAGSTQDFYTLDINGADISYITVQEQKELATLKTDIQNANESSGSTPATLYTMAQNGIAYLQTLQPSEYESAVGRAQEIDQEITEAEDAIHRDQVQTDIEIAEKPINQTAMILGWFAGNNSTADYPGLSNVSDQYQQSLNLLNQAEISMNAKDWSAAGDSAAKAYATGNSTLYAATALKTRASDPLTLLWDYEWYAVGVVVVAGLYLLFKPKKKKVTKDGE